MRKTKADLENEIKKLKRDLSKALKEADVACQALHEYRDVVATDERSLSSSSLMRSDLRMLKSGHNYTGARAEAALRKMPQAVRRRSEAYKKHLNKVNGKEEEWYTI